MQVIAAAGAPVRAAAGRPARRSASGGAACGAPARRGRGARARSTSRPARCCAPRLLRLGRRRARRCCSTLHHIVADGWSMGVLVRELGELYRRASPRRARRRCRRCRSSTPTTPPGSGAGWPATAARRGSSSTGGGSLPARRRCSSLPTDRPRPARAEPPRRRSCRCRAGRRPAASAAPRLAGGAGATLFMALLAGLQALLRPLRRPGRRGGRHPGGGPHPARRSKPLIGFFVNTLVLRTDLAGDAGLRRAAGAGARGEPGRLRPPGRAVREAGRGAAAAAQPRHTPLFQVMLALENAPQREMPAAAGLDASSRCRWPAATAKFDLTLALRRDGGGPASAS